MKKKPNIIFFISVLFLINWAGFGVSLPAGQDRYTNEGHGRREGHRAHGKRGFKPVPNQTYKNTCGECHLAYPPCLLPSGSWEKILNRMKDHFGEEVPCGATEQKEISQYLKENGADRASGKRSAKIMKGLKGTTPLRITEVPYIRHKHREISKEVLSRKTIGSLSNCRACHKTAEQGNFDDDNVTIPL